MGKLLLLIVGAAFAYSQTFEAVSIKPNPNPGGEASLQVVPGRLRIQNIPVRDLIQAAYGVEALQVTGGPKWLALDRFDIEAKAEGDPSTQQMQGPMLRALLEDRFKLIVHPDTIEGAVFELRVAEGSRKLQPSSAGDCIPYRPDAALPALDAPNQPRPKFCDFPHLGRHGRNRTLDGRGIALAEVAKNLARVEFHRPVLDKTGLTGMFDIHLEWTPEPPLPANNDEPAQEISIFTAMREQLGLRLDPGRAPVEIIVVDRVEKPSAN